ncbi:hypothetical protein MTBBW1_630011 [Desulfamplus magnetovallimortis]|uniref:Uncharacterized protein n=1 Tax=Desulfamplus magnetovallimortis TaxID=1246637 RepID=A0A1W1HIH7_9BACT|nr:hypothetical protein MTBBW1_630011 [Desulfamplus magnetovallimortis]
MIVYVSITPKYKNDSHFHGEKSQFFTASFISTKSNLHFSCRKWYAS